MEEGMSGYMLFSWVIFTWELGEIKEEGKERKNKEKVLPPLRSKYVVIIHIMYVLYNIYYIERYYYMFRDSLRN